MLNAPIPSDEAHRLALLASCNILYTPAEAAFDDVARLAADLCDTEIALITLIDADYQWFKARVGVELTGTPRDLSFCGHCITGHCPMVIEDTRLDARFADNPLVTGEPFLRFYAGVPLEVEPGSAIGALSVAGRAPRTLSERQLAALQRLARQISRELRLRRDLDRVSAASVPPTDAPLEPGTVIDGRWRIVRTLGRGSVGVVYEARDADDTRVAIKVLLPAWRAHDEAVERFAREARVLMRLRTPHVGQLLDVGNLEAGRSGLPFIVLEYLEGTDLDQRRARDGRVPFAQAFAWCADACAGIAEAHALGVVHRDIKPSNLFLADGRGGAPVVKVLDFGIAAGEPQADRSGRLTGAQTLVGSPAYMAPEQMMLASDVDPRSDVWSMGASLYELITGTIPFPGATALEMFAATMTRPPVPLRAHVRDELPGAVEAIIFKCLEKSRVDRFASMRALGDSLRAVIAP